MIRVRNSEQISDFINISSYSDESRNEVKERYSIIPGEKKPIEVEQRHLDIYFMQTSMNPCKKNHLKKFIK